MQENQHKFLSAYRLISYGLIALFGGAFAWDFIAAPSDGSSHFGSLLHMFNNIGGVVTLVVGFLAAVAFVALVMEFIKRGLTDAAGRSALGRPELEIGKASLAARLGLLALVGAVVAGLNFLVFGQGLLAEPLPAPSLTELLVFWFFYAVGHLFLLVVMVGVVRPRPAFVAGQNGFLYEPAGVSQGPILWADVAGLKEAELLVGPVANVGPKLIPALTVSLKDPERYALRLNPLLRLIQRLGARMVGFQIGASGDVVLTADMLGSRFAEVRDLMVRQVSRAGGKVERV